MDGSQDTARASAGPTEGLIHMSMTSRGATQYRRHNTSDRGGPYRCACRSCELARLDDPEGTARIEQEVAAS